MGWRYKAGISLIATVIIIWVTYDEVTQVNLCHIWINIEAYIDNLCENSVLKRSLSFLFSYHQRRYLCVYKDFHTSGIKFDD